MILSHIGIALLAALTSAISGDPNSPVDIGGIQTNAGTILVGVFCLAMLLMAFCFSPRDDGKGDSSPGMGYMIFIVFAVGMYVVGLTAH
jgi:hypothetical protein